MTPGHRTRRVKNYRALTFLKIHVPFRNIREWSSVEDFLTEVPLLFRLFNTRAVFSTTCALPFVTVLGALLAKVFLYSWRICYRIVGTEEKVAL
jgi:hypothetical protein